jgi:hypothetical protein
MFETILSMLPIPTWILIVLLSIIILWKIFVFVYETNNKNKDFKRLSDTIKTLENLMNKVKNDIKFIANYLSEKSEKNLDRTQIESCSPLRLTAVGTNFLKEIGFFVLFDSNKNDFFQIIDSACPTTKYDVEIAARKSFIILSDRDYFKSIKTYLFNNPSKRLDSISITAGVHIRDEYLKIHPEITQ